MAFFPVEERDTVHLEIYRPPDPSAEAGIRQDNRVKKEGIAAPAFGGEKSTPPRG